MGSDDRNEKGAMPHRARLMRAAAGWLPALLLASAAGLVLAAGSEWVGGSRSAAPMRYLPGTTRGLGPPPGVKAPPVTDAGFSDVLHARSSELKVYRFRANPRVYLFDFPSLHAQASALNRVAGLVEKMELPADRVIRQGELDSYFKENNVNPDTFYFGHNYRAEDLAEFFNLIERDKLELNPAEMQFLQLMVDLEILGRQRGVYKVPDPPLVVLTISQLQRDNPATAEIDYVDMAMRCTILRHELSHGEYSTNSRYRRVTRNFWRKIMSEEDRAAFREFLSSKGYDRNNDELMANEAQAYLMHSPNPRAFTPERAGLTKQRVEELREKFLKDAPDVQLLQIFYPEGEVSKRQRAELDCDF